MPIKIFAAPGDHRNDFSSVEDQVNAWMHENGARLQDLQFEVTAMPERREGQQFMMTVLIRYE